MLKKYFIIVKDIFFNIFLSTKYQLFYITENANWSTDWDGKYVVKNLNNQNLIKSKITSTPIGLKNKIIHFGSVNTYITKKGIKKIHSSNKIILTWFHIAPNDTRIKYIPQLNKTADIIVHTSCNITKNKLIKHGLNKKKIKVIPLGIDLNVFRPISNAKKNKLKEKLGIPTNKIIIGSFQKDGNGWKKGLQPKLIKGPDIFCDIVEKLAKKYSIHIVLTGPSRGYVKQRLKKANIPYTHVFLDNYLDIVGYYNILTAYLITSRAEGGPKALLEAMACEIPIVTTSVGMVPDIETSETNVLTFKSTAEACTHINTITQMDKKTYQKLSLNSRNVARNYDWKIIAKKYYDKMYAYF